MFRKNILTKIVEQWSSAYSYHNYALKKLANTNAK